jgi:hypothetical protein
MRHRSLRVLSFPVLGGFALVAAPVLAATLLTSLTIQNVTLSDPVPVPGSKASATIAVVNATPNYAGGHVELSWCELQPVTKKSKGNLSVSQKHVNCKSATPGSLTLMPNLKKRETANVTVKDLIVPNRCPIALVANFGDRKGSLDDPQNAFSTPVYPKRRPYGEFKVDSIAVEKDPKNAKARTAKVAYTLLVKTAPTWDATVNVIVEICRAERCEIKLKKMFPSPGRYTSSIDRSGPKPEQRWTAKAELDVAFELAKSEYFKNEVPNEIRVFVGDKDTPEQHIYEPRCDEPTAFKQPIK